MPMCDRRTQSSGDMKRPALNHYIHSYVHLGRIGVLLEFGLDTHAIEKSPTFQQLAIDLCLQISAQTPCDVADLIGQPFLKDPTRSVGEHLSQTAIHLKERIEVTRFTRWEAPAFKKNDELAPFQGRF
jgi:elongation factor Ts